MLRTLNCQHQLNHFIDAGFTDHWFPVTDAVLPDCLAPSQRIQFVAQQSLVITKSLDLQKGAEGEHAHFRKEDPLPFEFKGLLGTGGFGQVDKIITINSEQYACKRVLRARAFGGRGMGRVRQVIDEIQILKRIKHEHIVKFVGSYTDSRYIGLIMSPVADMDLSVYLTIIDEKNRAELRSFFGCLARALEFLHTEQVRHKDIKPSNILVKGGRVLFTDFGLAFDFRDSDHSTTTGPLNGLTRRYCAPEVAGEGARNSASDIWSLGVVFLEMVMVLMEKPATYLDNFFQSHGNHELYVRTNPQAFKDLAAEMAGPSDHSDTRVFDWLRLIFQEQHRLRPTATQLINIILAPTDGTANDSRYCGICCVVDDEFDDDDDDDIEDELERYRRV